MASISRLNNMFTFGEISPLLTGMANSAVYQSGAETMTNWLPMKTGGIRPRPGTRHVENNISQSRFLLFIGTDGTPYVLKFKNLSCEIYNTTTHSLVGSPTTTLTTLYPIAALARMQFAALGGEIWFVERGYAPQKITLSGSTWAIATPTFTGSRTFSTANNYPGAIAFYAGRLFLASTNAEPYAVFASQIPTAATGAVQYLNFALGTGLSTEAIYLLENSMLSKRIGWLSVAERIIAGTDKKIWMSDGSIPTPATFDLNVTSHDGAAEIQPQALDNMMLYVDSTKKKLKAMYFSAEGSGQFVDRDISEHATHLLSRGIEELQVMNNPEPIAWMRMSDGTLVSATIQLGANGIIAGFAPHELGGDGEVESLCIVPKNASDELWMAVKRGTVRTAEYLTFENLISTDVEDFYFVDNGLTVENTPASATVSGIAHLNGETVTAFGDGGVLPDETVAGGEVTYDVALSKVQVGLAYTSLFRSVKPELQLQAGTMQAKKKQILKITLRLYRTLGGSIGVDPDDLTELTYLITGSYVYGAAIVPFTGDKDVPIAAYIDTDGQFYIKRDKPVPVIVLAAITELAPVEV